MTAYLLFAQVIAIGLRYLHADIEESDQIGHLPGLIECLFYDILRPALYLIEIEAF